MLALPPARDDAFERTLNVLTWALKRAMLRGTELGLTHEQVQAALRERVESVIHDTKPGQG